MPQKYKYVLLETTNGLFVVSVPYNDALSIDGGGRLPDPRRVFEEGSEVVAVQVGAGRTNEYGDTSYDYESVGPQGNVKQNRCPSFGTYRLSFTDGGQPELTPHRLPFPVPA